MKVLMVEPGTEPYEKELNGLKEMQQAVGGLIQAIYPFEDKVAVVCDDEGMLKPNTEHHALPEHHVHHCAAKYFRAKGAV